MRILREFSFSDQIKASLFAWNGKFILKLESGNLEQTYKISETDVSGEAEVLDFCRQDEFRKAVAQTFDTMEGFWPPDF